jgi:Ser/Thr protein kinase RdoA (MazF antagonist)
VLTVPADRVAPAIARHWPVVGRVLRLEALPSGATSQVWLVHTDLQRCVVKLCFDTRPAFETGLAAAEHIEQSTGITTGAPIRTRAGSLSVLIPTFPGQEHPLALLTHVPGKEIDLHAAAAADLLARVHGGLRLLPGVVGHDALGYLTENSGDYAYQEAIAPAIKAVAAAVRAADLTWGTCYGDGPETVLLASGEVALLDWGGVLAGPVLWDVAEWVQGRGRAFADNFQARLVDLGFVSQAEMALLPLVSRVRAARELRFRAFRLARPDHYDTAGPDELRVRELAGDLGIALEHQ